MKSKKETKLYEWQKKLKNSQGECYKCKRVYYLSVEHIIPVSILLALNLKDETVNWEENLEVMCGACNKIKAGNLDISHPKTYSLLEESIRRSKAQIQ